MLLSLSASLALSLLRIAAAAVRLAASAALGLRDPADSACACEFYEGVVHHLRTKPKRHTLTYRVRYCLLDLDAARPPACCAAQLEDRLTAAQARSESGYDGRVLLLLLPGSAGFEENPIVVYYCHDAAGALRCCLAEVTNTPWGDRVRFAFAPSGDELPKAMHVSPLQDMASAWTLHASAPAERLALSVSCEHPELGRFFDASLAARRVAQPASSEAWAWLMPHRVAAWIYWHATLLLWAGVPFLPHPKSSDPAAYKRDILAKAEASGKTLCPAVGAAAVGQPRFSWRDAARYPWDG